MRAKLRRVALGAAITLAAPLIVAIPAVAHVTVAPTETPAEGYAKLDFSVPHGCESSPTTSISIQMPDQVVSATPQVVPGWKISMKEGELAQPVESHGETITTGVREVTWSGGPLDAHHLEVFGLSVRFMGSPGDRVPFKIVQRCKDGEEAWIQVSESGDEELEYPAPVVNLVGADENTETGGGDDSATAEADESADPAAAATDEGDGDGSGPLPLIALLVAIAALIASIASLMTRRK